MGSRTRSPETGRGAGDPGFGLGRVRALRYETFAAVDEQHNWAGLVDPATERWPWQPRLLRQACRPTGLVSIAQPGRLYRCPSGTGYAEVWKRRRPSVLASRAASPLAPRYAGRPILRRATFLRDEVARRGVPARAYSPEGRMLDSQTSALGTAAALAALLTLDPVAAESMYAAQLVGSASRLGAGADWAI